MKFSVTALSALVAMAYAMPSSPKKPRDINEVLASLKRDPTGQGFTHIGSDNVARTFDGRFQVVDSAALDARSDWASSPDPSVLGEARRAVEQSLRHVASRPRARSVVEARQESCVSEFCPDDQYCKDLYIYGYNCSSCLIVSNGIGNCQQF